MSNTKEFEQIEGAIVDLPEIKEPKMFKVVLLNDDYTTMDFVVMVLETIFNKSPAEATKIMLNVHKLGSGTCGIYVKQIAETKASLVHKQAKKAGYPLKCSLEEV